MEICKEILEEKSKKYKLPFSKILQAAIVEALLEIIVSSVHGEYLWLVYTQQLGIDFYQKKVPDKLSFVYVGEEEEEKIVSALKEDISKGMTTYRVSMQDMGEGHFSFYVGEMYVPITLSIKKGSSGRSLPQTATLNLFLSEKKISFYQYPLEQEVAFHFTEIMYSLELTNDMESYALLYQILCNNTLEGRKIQEAFLDFCKTKHINIEEKPLKIMEKYGDYSYMRKKWKVQLRIEGSKEPKWKDVHTVIFSCLEPIWTCSSKDLVFFGDWMPELRRFLD